MAKLIKFDKEQADFWGTAFKGVAGVVGIFGAFLTLSKYFDEKKKENHNALLVAQAPFFAKRQGVYYLLVSTTAIIGNVPFKSRQRRVAEAEFWRLYWGGVPMVADVEVARAVDKFTDALTLPEDKGVEERKFIDLRNASMDLARACRKSLGFDGPHHGTAPYSKGVSVTDVPVMEGDHPEDDRHE